MGTRKANKLETLERHRGELQEELDKLDRDFRRKHATRMKKVNEISEQIDRLSVEVAAERRGENG